VVAAVEQHAQAAVEQHAQAAVEQHAAAQSIPTGRFPTPVERGPAHRMPRRLAAAAVVHTQQQRLAAVAAAVDMPVAVVNATNP
jgi:hypothetical protein